MEAIDLDQCFNPTLSEKIPARAGAQPHAGTATALKRALELNALRGTSLPVRLLSRQARSLTRHARPRAWGAAATATTPGSLRRATHPHSAAEQGQLPTYGHNVRARSPADAPISMWEEMFLPVRRDNTLRTMRVTDTHEQQGALVRSEMALFTRAGRLSTRPRRNT